MKGFLGWETVWKPIQKQKGKETVEGHTVKDKLPILKTEKRNLKSLYLTVFWH